MPEGWEWARLKDICSMAAGKAKATSEIKDKPFDNCYPCFGGNGFRGYVDKYNQDGTFNIIGRQGALCGNINVATGKFYATEHAVVVTLFSNIDFFWSNYMLEGLNLNGYSTGVAQPGLSVVNVLNVFVPLPPQQEQLRIGKTIESIMKIIADISDKHCELLHLLNITKSKILDLAICGKLVPQDPNDEPTSVLLERIRAEREELIKQGKIKRNKKDSTIYKSDDNSYYEKFSNGKCRCIDDEIPFESPDGWEWCNLSMIGTTNVGLTYRPINIKNDGTIVLRSSNIVNEKIDLNDLVRVKTKIRDNQYVQPNDILICARNGSKALVGKCALIYNLKEPASFGAFMAVYRTSYYQYVLHYLRSSLFRSVFDDSNSTAINQLTQDMLKRALIPLPPIAEQERIVILANQLLLQLQDIEKCLS